MISGYDLQHSGYCKNIILQNCKDGQKCKTKFQQKYQRINGELFILFVGSFLKDSNSGVAWKKCLFPLMMIITFLEQYVLWKVVKKVEKGLKPVFGEKFKNLKKLM